MNDLLLASLAYSLFLWTKSKRHLIALEGHGREDICKTSIENTIGWFTTVFPVELEVSGGLVETLKKVKGNLAEIPNKGIGFGMLLHFAKDEKTREVLKTISRSLSSISFNYLGQFKEAKSIDEDTEGDSQFELIPLGTQPVSAKNAPEHEININGSISGTTLSIGFAYRTDLFLRSTMEKFVRSFEGNIKQLIAMAK